MSPSLLLPTQARPMLLVALQAQVMQEQGFKTWVGWGVDTLHGCVVENREDRSYVSGKAEMNADIDLVTVHQAASALAAAFPPGFPQPSSGLVELPQQPPISALPQLSHGLGSHPEQEPISAFPHPPPGLAEPTQQQPILPPPHQLVHPPQQEALPALSYAQQQQPAAARQPQPDPAADGQPVVQARQRRKKDEVDGDYFYCNRLAFPRYQQLRLHSNATFDWVGGGGDEEQERLQEETEARRRQQQADRFWKKRDIWDHSGFIEIANDWGDHAPAIPGPEATPTSPSSQHSALLGDTWGSPGPALLGPEAAPVSPSPQPAVLLNDAWGNGAPAIPAPVAAAAVAASAEHADQLGDAWGWGAPAIPSPEASPSTMPAAHAGAALLPDDTAADQATGSDAGARAAVGRRGRPRKCTRSRQGNSSRAITGTRPPPQNSAHLLPGHAQQGVQHALEYPFGRVSLCICGHLHRNIN